MDNHQERSLVTRLRARRLAIMSKSTRLILIISLLGCITIGFALWILHALVIPWQTSTMVRTARDLCYYLQQATPDLNSLQQQKLLQELKSNSRDLAYILIENTNGKVLAHSSPEQVGTIFNDHGMLAAARRGITAEQTYSQVANDTRAHYLGRRTMDILMPIYDKSGNIVAGVDVGLDLNRLDETTRQHYLAFAVGSMVFVLILSLVTFLLLREVVESEEKFRALAENAEAQIFIAQGSRYVYANPYFSRLTGYTNEELLSKDVIEFVHPDSRELISERMIKRLAGEPVPNHYEFALLGKDGRKIWLDYSAARIEYKGKAAIVGVGYDITERKKTEEEKRAFYRETILSATDDKLDVTDESTVKPYIENSQTTINVREASKLVSVRDQISRFCSEHGLNGDPLADFISGVGEAIDNTLKHDGEAHVYVGNAGNDIWVAVCDSGPGIESLVFPRAVLRRGFSTKPSMGLGYSIMLEASDQILLNTGKGGTTVVLVKKVIEETKSLLDNLPDTWEGIHDLK